MRGGARYASWLNERWLANLSRMSEVWRTTTSTMLLLPDKTEHAKKGTANLNLVRPDADVEG